MSAKNFRSSQLFAVSVTVNKRRLRVLKDPQGELVGAIMEGAQHWQKRILPDHFKRGAHAKYGYADRSRRYLRRAEKRGKPDLVMSGSMSNELRRSPRFKERARSVQLRMHARVLNISDAGKNSFAERVRLNDGRRYPNMHREIKKVVPEEQEQVAQIVAESLEKRLNKKSKRKKGK